MLEHEDLMGTLNRNYEDYGMDKWRILPLVVANKYNKYIATGEYPYLEQVKQFIMKDLPPLTEQQENNLKTLCYNAATRYRETEVQEHRDKLISEGWKPVTEEICRAAATAKKKLLIHRETEGILSSGTEEKIYKLTINARGDCFFMAPKASRIGFLWHRFRDAFYKEVNYA